MKKHNVAESWKKVHCVMENNYDQEHAHMFFDTVRTFLGNVTQNRPSRFPHRTLTFCIFKQRSSSNGLLGLEYILGRSEMTLTAIWAMDNLKRLFTVSGFPNPQNHTLQYFNKLSA